ncbi:putative polyketide synthase, partial [Emericellopsis cladophorae]
AERAWLQDSLEDVQAEIRERGIENNAAVKIATLVGETMPRVFRGETTMLEHLCTSGLLDEYYANGPFQSGDGLIFGTLPGWWLGADEGRTLSPFVSASQWDTILMRGRPGPGWGQIPIWAGPASCRLFAEAIEAGQPDSPHGPEFTLGLREIPQDAAKMPKWAPGPKFSHFNRCARCDITVAPTCRRVKIYGAHQGVNGTGPTTEWGN